MPDGVLAVPFAGAMLPISWLTNCELVMAELDQDFYNSIPEFKKGFVDMYPDAEFRGYLSVKEIKECRPQKTGRAATFFSGGLDATTTLLRHIQEKPDLFILWGSDVDFNNAEGWNVVWKDIVCKANQYQLNCAYVRTSFRIFDDEMALSQEFEPVLHYRWWYAIKYGIGLITHAAPYAWLHGISDWYIASSKCIEDGNTVGASYPTIDNYIRFCGCSVHHDGFEWNRQQKTHFIVEYSRKHPDAVISLRVCYKSADGDNCCHCEKCYRTMVEFFVEGEDPRKFGMNYPDDALEHMKQYMTLHCNQLQFKSWNYAKRTLRTNWDALQDKPWRNKLGWMLDFNFDDLESNLCRIQYKKSWKVKGIIVKLFPHLYKLYVKMRGYSYDE